MAGMMMAIANAASDKMKYCAEYGIEISVDEWPCRGVPGAILGDRGANWRASLLTRSSTH